MKPPATAANKLLDIISNHANYEQAIMSEAWQTLYGSDMEYAQAVMDSIPTANDINKAPTTAAAVFTISSIQVVTHNLTAALLANPALLANETIQEALAALAAVRNVEGVTAVVNDTVPYDYAYNPDGTITYTEIPEEE